jgi:hypothetical protein
MLGFLEPCEKCIGGVYVVHFLRAGRGRR